MKYNLLRFSLLSIFAMLFGVVHADSYQKVTSTSDITDGEYLIVYETGGVAFNGALETLDAVDNTIAVEVDNNQIASSASVDAAVFTIDVANGTLKSASGKYIGVTSNSNGLKTSDDATAYNHTFSIDGDGNAVIASVFEGSTMTLRFNAASNQNRFRYYKSGQQAIQLYKKSGATGDTRVATTVELGDYTASGMVGEQVSLPTATVMADGSAVGGTIEWTSSNTDVAAINGSVIDLLAPGTSTIKASFDGDNSYKPSNASFTLTVMAAPYNSLAALQADATSTDAPVTVVFNNVFVTAVKGSNAYLADADGYGVLVFKKDHGLEAGQLLNGSAEATLVLYRGQTELKNLSTDGLTITTTEIVPTVKTIDAITPANQSTLVQLKNVTYSEGKLTDGTNEITYYDNFGVEFEFEEGKAYDVTGIVILYNTTLELAPRTVDDIVEAGSTGPGDDPQIVMEKKLYSTDFSEWTTAGAAASESVVTWTTKYSKETLNFMLYNTAIMSTSDTKFAAYTDLPHTALQAAKAADPYVMTSPLASITKVRYIHGATGSNRGWKMEAKGDGDDDWVVISDAVASPNAWSEVSVDVNRTNCQLRWTNLNASQNAYMFELDIYGNVDMGTTPMLGSFKANGVEYVAGDIFEEQADGSMTATIEIAKGEQMISEGNPITDVVADNGTVGVITYEGANTSCTVTIPVTLGENTVNYIAQFLQKEDFTLTYYNTDGTVMGTQQVEKDAAIGSFAYDFNAAAASEGQKVRGWFVAADGGRKFTVADIITENTSLYAVQTPIEVQSPNERYTFNLNDQYFYAEDHEAFEPVGNGKFHDTTHGWVFAGGDKVNLLVGGNANIVLYLCNYSGGNAITLTNAGGQEVARIESDKVSPDGAIGTLEYVGEAGVITLNFSGTSYLHKLIVANQAQPLYSYDEATKTYNVTAGETAGFLGALDEANAAGNVTIYLPNGTYDLGNECLTTISGENITIKGESQTETVILNLPKAEGIGVTATLLNTSNGLTLENLTLKNAYPYYDPATGKASAFAGRAVCLQDKGNYTVCRNVTMLSYQDTYYSNNSSGQFYFGNCEIHGLVDFVCGGGDVFFENTTFYLESREVAEGKGDVTIAAPNGAKQYGYVMDGCVIDCHSATFNWGRSWGSVANLAWLNTTLKQPSAIVSSRFTAAGMNCAADGFFEYNTMDEAGNVISPASNIILFTHSSGNKEYETILTAEGAAQYSKDNVFADAPKAFKDRVGIGTVGIDSVVKVAPRQDAIYNLQGVRVQQAVKGLYIVNGKKVVK